MNDYEGLLVMLLREGSRRHAIKLYQEETGSSLVEADGAVAEIAHRHNIRRGYRSMLAMAVLGLCLFLGMLVCYW